MLLFSSGEKIGYRGRPADSVATRQLQPRQPARERSGGHQPLPASGWLSVCPDRSQRLVLGVSVVALLVMGAALRCFEYDETYTHALSAGLFPPDWPLAPFLAGEARAWFDTAPSHPWRIVTDLIRYDTHPPLYFWLVLVWRALFGPDPLVIRLLSVLLTLGSAAVFWRLALVAKVPPLPAVACAFLAYAMLYTGVIARAYPLALLLLLIGTLLLASVLREAADGPRRGHAARAAAAGLAFGLAILCHYLAALTAGLLLAGFGMTMLAWRRWPPAIAAGLGLMPPLLAALLIRRNQGSADWHLAGFDWGLAIVSIARGQTAALFGGTPLYVEGAGAQLALIVLVAAALLLLAGAILLALPAILADPVRRVMLLAAVGGPLTLLALGWATERSPFEFRYFVFGVPYVALSFAAGLGALGARRPRLAAVIGAYVLAWQFVGAAAMPFAQETQQDYRVAVRAAEPYMRAGAALLVPIAADGIGMNGPFVWEAPADWTLRVIRPNEPPEAVLAQLGNRPRLVLTTMADGVGREAIRALRPALEAAGWRPRPVGPFVEVWER